MKGETIGYIRNIIPFSSVDGPGNRTAVFLQGCNLNCLYCHNPETIEIPRPNTEVEGVSTLRPLDLIKEIEPYFDYISGITFSGGECTVQGAFLAEACELLKEKGQHVLIDTNGKINKETLERLMPTVDGFMLDIKAFSPEKHMALTGHGNESILITMEKMALANKLYEIRTVIVEGFLNNEETVEAVSKFIAEKSPTTRYKLIQYRPHGVRETYIQSLKSPDRTQMAKLYKLAHDFGVREIILL